MRSRHGQKPRFSGAPSTSERTSRTPAPRMLDLPAGLDLRPVGIFQWGQRARHVPRPIPTKVRDSPSCQPHTIDFAIVNDVDRRVPLRGNEPDRPREPRFDSNGPDHNQPVWTDHVGVTRRLPPHIYARSVGWPPRRRPLDRVGTRKPVRASEWAAVKRNAELKGEDCLHIHDDDIHVLRTIRALWIDPLASEGIERRLDARILADCRHKVERDAVCTANRLD